MIRCCKIVIRSLAYLRSAISFSISFTIPAASTPNPWPLPTLRSFVCIIASFHRAHQVRHCSVYPSESSIHLRHKVTVTHVLASHGWTVFQIDLLMGPTSLYFSSYALAGRGPVLGGFNPCKICHLPTKLEPVASKPKVPRSLRHLNIRHEYSTRESWWTTFVDSIILIKNSQSTLNVKGF